jgi:N-acetyl-beta-hexosaminidase
MTNTPELQAAIDAAADQLNAHTLEMIHWHFGDDTGCPFC